MGEGGRLLGYRWGTAAAATTSDHPRMHISLDGGADPLISGREAIPQRHTASNYYVPPL